MVVRNNRIVCFAINNITKSKVETAVAQVFKNNKLIYNTLNTNTFKPVLQKIRRIFQEIVVTNHSMCFLKNIGSKTYLIPPHLRPLNASTSSTVFGTGLPSTRWPSCVTSTLSSMRIPPKLRQSFSAP